MTATTAVAQTPVEWTDLVGVSADGNSAYDHNVAGSGSTDSGGLYHLDVRVVGNLAVPPALFDFDDALIPDLFTLFTADATGQVIATDTFANSGTHSLLLGDTDFSETLVQATATSASNGHAYSCGIC